MKANFGILYVATGKKFVAEAEISASSAKSAMPGVPIVLASDCTSDSGYFDMHIKLERSTYSFIDKILPLKRTPFERTLYLDSDTFVLSDVSCLFQILDRFAIAAAFEPARFLDKIDGLPTCFAELNTGVLLYKSDRKVFAMIDQWHAAYSEEIANMAAAGRQAWHDQYSFTKIMFENDLSLYVLPPEYNARILLPLQASGPIKIVHSRLKRSSNYENQLAFLNSAEDSVRLFNPNPRRFFEFSLATLKLFRLLYRS
jgi:hypothetical protein